MKRTGFKPKTLDEVKATQALRSHTINSKPLKPLKRSNLAKRTPKRKKDGSLTKAEEVRILKKKLWAIFSQYIRKRDADHTGWLMTVDGEWALWKECDCGHLWHNSDRSASLGGNELWYYENNFAPQSNQGNRLNKDDSAQKYMLAAVKKYGQDEIDRMRQMKQTYKLWTLEELQEKYRHYKALFEALI